MKFNLGKTLRKIRKEKQISISSVADEHLSKSQISRFERGESEISCARLINILDKLNISLEEFLIIHNNDFGKCENFMNLIQHIREDYTLHRVISLKNTLYCNIDLTDFDRTMLKSIIYALDSSHKPTDEELLKLTDYLFKIENWGYYEIILLGNCVRTIEYSSYFLLTKEMLKNYIYSSLNKTNKKLVTQLAINCLIASIDAKKYNNCRFLIKEISRLLDNELNYYEQTVFLYAQGYLEFAQGAHSGISKMRDALQIFDILNESSIKKQYEDHLSSLIDK